MRPTSDYRARRGRRRDRERENERETERGEFDLNTPPKPPQVVAALAPAVPGPGWPLVLDIIRWTHEERGTDAVFAAQGARLALRSDDIDAAEGCLSAFASSGALDDAWTAEATAACLRARLRDPATTAARRRTLIEDIDRLIRSVERGEPEMTPHLLAGLARAAAAAGRGGAARGRLLEAARRSGTAVTPAAATALLAHDEGGEKGSSSLSSDSRDSGDRAPPAAVLAALLRTSTEPPDVQALTAVVDALGREEGGEGGKGGGGGGGGEGGRETGALGGVAASSVGPDAAELLAWMRKRARDDPRLAPTAVTLSVRASGLVGRGDVDGGITLLSTMETEWGVRPNHQSWAAALRRARGASAARALWRAYLRMVDEGSVDSTHGDPRVALGCLMKALLDSGASGATLQRELEMAQGPPLNVAPNGHHVNMVVAATARHEGYLAAAAVAGLGSRTWVPDDVDAATSAGGSWRPDRVTHETLLDAAAAEGRRADAERHAAALAGPGAVPGGGLPGLPASAASALLRAHLEAGEGRAGAARCGPLLGAARAEPGRWAEALRSLRNRGLVEECVGMYGDLVRGRYPGCTADATCRDIAAAAARDGVAAYSAGQLVAGGFSAAGLAAGAMLIRAGLL